MNICEFDMERHKNSLTVEYVHVH